MGDSGTPRLPQPGPPQPCGSWVSLHQSGLTPGIQGPCSQSALFLRAPLGEPAFPSPRLPPTPSPFPWPQRFLAQPAGALGCSPPPSPRSRQGWAVSWAGPGQPGLQKSRPGPWWKRTGPGSGAQGTRGNSVLHGKSGAATLRAVGGEPEGMSRMGTPCLCRAPGSQGTRGGERGVGRAGCRPQLAHH